MAKNMSFKSVSYNRVGTDFEAQSDRFSKEVSYLPVRSQKDDKLTQLSYLKDNTAGLQSVFRAEFIKTFTKTEIQKHLNNLKIGLEEAAPGMIFKISCHPQSDATTKSSHFHIWGDVTPEMEKVFEEYLINNKLTIQDKVNITSISKGNLIKVDLNEDGNEEFKKITYVNRTGHFIVGKDKIKARNVTESVILDTIEIQEQKEDKTASIDDNLKERLKKADEKLVQILESQEFLTFEKEYEKTFEKLNDNLSSFLNERKNKLESIEERIKKSLQNLEDI